MAKFPLPRALLRQVLIAQPHVHFPERFPSILEDRNDIILRRQFYRGHPAHPGLGLHPHAQTLVLGVLEQGDRTFKGHLVADRSDEAGRPRVLWRRGTHWTGHTLIVSGGARRNRAATRCVRTKRERQSVKTWCQFPESTGMPSFTVDWASPYWALLAMIACLLDRSAEQCLEAQPLTPSARLLTHKRPVMARAALLGDYLRRLTDPGAGA
jgi:hypothetical protein